MSSKVQPDRSRVFAENLQRARAGDQQAFARLVRPVYGVLRARAYRGLHKEAVPAVSGSDVAQSTLVEAMEHLANFRGNTEREFWAWLYSILDHLVLDENRHVWVVRRRRMFARQAPVAQPDTGAAGPQPDRATMKAEERLHLSRALTLLSEEEKVIIHLRFWQKLSWQQVAQVVGSSPAGVRMRCRRILRRVGSVLGGETIDFLSSSSVAT